MESLKPCKANSFLTLLIFFSSTLLCVQAVAPSGTIERAARQQLLASIPPVHEATPTSSGSSQLFLTSPSGKYSAFLLRRETSFGAGGFGNDFCYIQVQDESGQSVWESECASVSNVNSCTLVFSDAGLEIFDGSRSSWDTNADGEQLETLEMLDKGDMQIRDKDGNLIWKASDNPISNQNCGSIGAPGLAPALPPFAKPISNGNLPFGQSANNQGQNSQLGDQQQLGDSRQNINQPFSGLNQLGSPLGQTFGVNQQQPLIDNTPFNSASSREAPLKFGVALVTMITILTYFGFLL
ncbi:PREDICTED: uncharacterized protein LOC104607594 [Nelumbo nucifera]|uniref:Uncharacterized protein LOC104607594 n=1 Tax=Nelumbo nucifera TaxID=4432 RepID=A0A1U8Q8T7_NELNU|nr:PREDICTED: uncharacterized protein LOC104607594 [Nelumbo nucifera]